MQKDGADGDGVEGNGADGNRTDVIGAEGVGVEVVGAERDGVEGIDIIVNRSAQGLIDKMWNNILVIILFNGRYLFYMTE